MIQPVRNGYIGQDHPIDPMDLPPTAAQLYPQIAVSEIYAPSAAGPIRCQVFSAPKATASRPMLLYIHGGGFTVGRSEDTAYITSRIAKETGFVVVSLNYRLAPEWPFRLAWMTAFLFSIGCGSTGRKLKATLSR